MGYGQGVSSGGVRKDMAFPSVLRTFEDKVMDSFVRFWAYRAMRGVGFIDAMEVVVEGDMSGTKLDIHAGVAFGEAVYELEVLSGWHGWVDFASSGIAG